MEKKDVVKKSNNKTKTSSEKTDSKKNVKKTSNTKDNSSSVSKTKSTALANKSATSKSTKNQKNVKGEKSNSKESAKSNKSIASKSTKNKKNVKEEKNNSKESAKTSKNVKSSVNSNNVKKEKKVCNNGVYWVIAFLIIVAILVCTYNIISERNNSKRNDTLFFITESFDTNDNINLNETIQTLSRFKEIFGELDVANELDFINHNYAILELEYNPCKQEKLTPNVKRIFGKDIDVDVSFNAKCGTCADENVYYLIAVNKNISFVNVNVNYKQNTYVLCK